ncbi:receptor-like protein 56 [Quercus suber]|uniref:Receptor-like protein 56 n=1 Tax=Quercus suber TaxID=58331 RepID=A0AAW0LPU2_QUESU
MKHLCLTHVNVDEEIEFATKNKTYFYNSDILTEMTSVAVFSVAHNYLSGRTPDRKNQLFTFDESSYEGNPLLCGPPLHNGCTKMRPLSIMPMDI